jgi:cysteine desulfurase / selenocysteine lyase
VKSIDVERVRQDTPGCGSLIHLNNAGSSLMARPVTEAVIGHLRLEERAGGYEALEMAQSQIDDTYEAIAALIGAKASEIAIVDSATRAWNLAFFAQSFSPGDRILTCEAEYASNYISFLQAAERQGVRITVVRSDESGQISLVDLENQIDDQVKLIAMTHVPTNGGLVNPAEDVGAIARRAGIPFLLDACQSAGQMPLDVDSIGCDMLSVTGRKFLRGPRGTGFLYVRQDRIAQMDPPFIDLYGAQWSSRDHYTLRADAKRFENYEQGFAAKIGLGVAVRYALELGIDAIETRLTELAQYLRAALSGIDGLELLDIGARQCAIVTFRHPRIVPRDLMLSLRPKGINIWTSNRRSTRIDMEERGLEDIVRLSVHYYNTEREIDRVVGEIARAAV